jgi:microsomal dipeptidase-like Zn-dependent dipeptidase
VVIDGLGGWLSDFSEPPDARLSPSVIGDIKLSGLTAVNVTVGATLLLDRGHSEKRVRKVLGENLQRLFNEVWPIGG